MAGATYVGDIQIVCPTHGERFRVLPRTDGMHIVYDPCQPLGRQTVRGLAFPNVHQAVALARGLALAESLEQLEADLAPEAG